MGRRRSRFASTPSTHLAPYSSSNTPQHVVVGIENLKGPFPQPRLRFVLERLIQPWGRTDRVGGRGSLGRASASEGGCSDCLRCWSTKRRTPPEVVGGVERGGGKQGIRRRGGMEESVGGALRSVELFVPLQLFDVGGVFNLLALVERPGMGGEFTPGTILMSGCGPSGRT